MAKLRKDPELHEAFSAALRRVATSQRYVRSTGQMTTCHICIALSKAQKDGAISSEACHRATTLISKRLDGCVSYGEWLRTTCQMGEQVKHDINHNGWRKLQDGRRRWLKALIKEFS